jgi:hypothetical protein
MKSRTSIWSILVLATLLAFLRASSSEAATKYVQSTGTSNGPGTAAITIESFAPNGPNRAATGASNVQAMTLINVSIPSGSTPANSTTLIRNDVDAALPAEYLVTIAGGGTVVIIERPAGDFTMGILEDVPGQTISEFVPAAGPSVPMLGDRSTILASLLLLTAGMAFLLRRRQGRMSA